MIQLPEFALDVAVAPRRVVSGHANDQGSDRLHDPRSADTGVGLGPLGGDQPAVPAHDRVRCHGGGDSREHLASEGLAPRRESAALVVSQSEALSVELFLEHTILLEEILDDLCLVPGAWCLVPGARCLVAVGEARECGEEEPEREDVERRIPITGSTSERRKLLAERVRPNLRTTRVGQSNQCEIAALLGHTPTLPLDLASRETRLRDT